MDQQFHTHSSFHAHRQPLATPQPATMYSASPAPYASDFLRVSGELTTVIEGFTWQEVITRVYGFRITATDRILSLKNLCIKDATPVESLCSSEDDFLFLLVADEIVLRLEIFYSDSVIKAVRFQTNKRVSQWFGEPTGDSKVITARSGCAINAIQTRYGATGCTQISTVGLPLAVIETEYSSSTRTGMKVEKSNVVASSSCGATPFLTYCKIPRAIVFKAGIAVFDIDVLSQAEYDRYIATYRLWKPTASQHMLVLTENERIEAVGVTVSGDNLLAICVKTNLQTSQWFGKAVPYDATWFDCSGCPGSYICGFQLLGRYISGIGVVYAVPQVRVKSKTDVVAAHSAKRSQSL